MQKCIICGDNLTYFKTLYDDRYGYPGKFSMLTCAGCGHKSLDARFQPAELGRLYTDFYPRSNFRIEDYQPYVELNGFKAWLDGSRSFAFRWVPRNVRVLDIGCGFGETLGYHKARGCEVYGVEADANIRRVAERFGYSVHVGLFDPALYEPGSFDYVTMDQVMEHIPDPLQTLRDIAAVLKPGGYAVLGIPNAGGWGACMFGSRWISWHIPYHLQFFSKASMKIAADRAGFIIERVKTVTSSDYLYLQWNHLICRPAPGSKSAFWTGEEKRSGFRKLVSKILLALHLMKINHLVTRLFDTLGVGDNYLYVLRKK